MNRALRLATLVFGLSVLTLLLSGCGTGSLRPGSFNTVVIDAGHGGKDSGEYRRRIGLQEKELALDTALRLQRLLKREGFRTVMTRSGDYFVELDGRVAIANRYYPNAVLVSVHYNASGSSAPRGLETYFWRGDSYGLAVRVQRHMLAQTGQVNHGVIRRVLRLTRNPVIPSILLEGGYLTNPTDAAAASTPSYRQNLAEGIAAGIVEEHDRGDAEIGVLPPVRSLVNVPPSRGRYRAPTRQRSARVVTVRRRGGSSRTTRSTRGRRTIKSSSSTNRSKAKAKANPRKRRR